ncbi:hypothetical protein ACOQFV_24070 [Nocardiopsis changdeensis]|uniref:LexA repressor DNA-binding domain-containing protein n=1 Tax=Nocardiopsis changdeensis TaxID=2831969 RepID=A0A975QCD4_9ACTN|nr:MULTISPECIES: hypothetical protein [Nocardiopsis]QUX26528.1 hypothetical protein KGD84_33050 [Nocardiopsis changdeensis]QYX40647.1 hypothetical protein K1J57_32120 [Nocardiopsis sp. MT53]
MPQLLTAPQSTVLHAIAALTQEMGHAPTLREIGARAGLASASSVTHHVRALERLGMITRNPRAPRSVRLVGAAATAPVKDLPDLVALTRTAHDAEQRTRAAESELSTLRTQAARARTRAERLERQVKTVRALHKPVPEHPRALLDPHGSDTECIACGRDVFTDQRRHHFDLLTETWRCTARGARSPMVCPVCRDGQGRRLAAPCPTFQAVDPTAP